MIRSGDQRIESGISADQILRSAFDVRLAAQPSRGGLGYRDPRAGSATFRRGAYAKLTAVVVLPTPPLML